MKYGAIIVETRAIKNLPEIIKSHMKFLPGWELTIYYGADNEKMLKESFPEAKFNDFLIGRNPESYCNDVLSSLEFWETIPYDKVLTFHHDSDILRLGVEEFLEYDYVGSPWENIQEGGNGGFSIRGKKAHIDLLKAMPFDLKYGNEDEYFSKYLAVVGGKVAPRDVCFKFGCETIFKLGTFGYHAIDKYMCETACKQIKTQYENN
jgi:hypothetical protein